MCAVHEYRMYVCWLYVWYNAQSVGVFWQSSYGTTASHAVLERYVGEYGLVFFMQCTVHDPNVFLVPFLLLSELLYVNGQPHVHAYNAWFELRTYSVPPVELARAPRIHAWPHTTPNLPQSLSKEVAQLREQGSQQRARCEEAEQLRGREAREGAERIARLTADKKKLEERLKVHKYMHTYIRIYVCTYMHTYIHT